MGEEPGDGRRGNTAQQGRRDSLCQGGGVGDGPGQLV